jgi:hypothetical protein
MMHWIESLVAAVPDAAPCEAVAQWWQRHLVLARGAGAGATMPVAIAGGFAADRVGWAYASAYQAALRALVPALPYDTLAALCVTEAEGNSPGAIRSELRRVDDATFRLDGAKRWTTLGPEGAVFLVAAREGVQADGRPRLRVALVRTDSPGIVVEPMPPTKFVPEVPHAQLRFEGVRVRADALLPGDGYEGYVKRFRTVEDTHVTAGVLAYLVREARRFGWPPGWIERAIGALVALDAVAALHPLANGTHLALAGVLGTVDGLVADSEPLWAAAPDEAARSRWRRDRALLKIAEGTRRQRTARAWERARAQP